MGQWNGEHVELTRSISVLKEHQSAANPFSLDCFEIKKYRCSLIPESCQAIMLTFIIWRIKVKISGKMGRKMNI